MRVLRLAKESARYGIVVTRLRQQARLQGTRSVGCDGGFAVKAHTQARGRLKAVLLGVGPVLHKALLQANGHLGGPTVG
ncbi:hypothetical protein [Streptomyces sp. NPDC045251]|uniref:hypothetical protein n=1 Tax=unclassified Streptomyces TaxID=2593676 RepID=UPI0033E89617